MRYMTTMRTSVVHGSGAANQTHVQLMQQRLRERFGVDILRHPEEKTRQRDRINEENVGS